MIQINDDDHDDENKSKLIVVLGKGVVFQCIKSYFDSPSGRQIQRNEYRKINNK